MGGIVLVVFIHSYNYELKFDSGGLTDGQGHFVLFVENFFSKGIALIAVPLFFAISGFLFYQSYNFTVSGVATKFKRKLSSLVIPYLFWSVFGLILVLSLQSIPWSKIFFTKELIIDYSFSKLMHAVLVEPIPYQLWFVRDLIMLVIFSPLIWYLTKAVRDVWLLVLLVLWTVNAKTFELFSNEALLFFTVGCALALDKTELINKKLSKFLSYGLLCVWLLIVSATTYLITFDLNFFALSALKNLGVLTGLIAVWSLYDYFDEERLAKYSAFFGYSFFIFVFHEPLLTILKKGMFFLLGKTNFSSLLIYVVAPLIAIGISMIVSYVWRRRLPRFYNFATGGR